MCRELCYFRENKNKSGKTLHCRSQEKMPCAEKVKPMMYKQNIAVFKENDAIWAGS